MEDKKETRPTTELSPIDFYGTEKKENPDVTMQPGLSQNESMVNVNGDGPTPITEGRFQEVKASPQGQKGLSNRVIVLSIVGCLLFVLIVWTVFILIAN